MSNEQAECRGILLRETASAILVTLTTFARPDQQWWFPRSQLGYVKKTHEGDVTYITFTCPEWLVENKTAWELVP